MKGRWGSKPPDRARRARVSAAAKLPQSKAFPKDSNARRSSCSERLEKNDGPSDSVGSARGSAVVTVHRRHPVRRVALHELKMSPGVVSGRRIGFRGACHSVFGEQIGRVVVDRTRPRGSGLKSLPQGRGRSNWMRSHPTAKNSMAVLNTARPLPADALTSGSARKAPSGERPSRILILGWQQSPWM